MTFYFLLPVFLGLTVVVQGQLNRHISVNWGLAAAVLLNAVIFLALNFALYVWVRATPDFFPEMMRTRETGLRGFSWWYLLPGACGFALVLGLPWAFQTLGTAKALILLVAAQILFGFLWDYFFSDIPVSKPVLLGALLTLTGASITIFSK